MNWHQSKKFFCIGSLLYFSLGAELLHATVSVTTSANSGAGSLRTAIESINTGSVSPISLDPGANPTLTTNMAVSTLSASIIAANSPTTHTITGGGNTTLNVGEATVTLSVSEDIIFATAHLVITAGTLQLNGPNNLHGITNVIFSGANPILQFSNIATGTVSSPIQLLGTLNVLKIDPTLTITASGTISGAILEKQGTGTLILPNSNIYGGGTIITAGKIEIGNATSLGAATITMLSGTTLQIAAGISLLNNFTLDGLPCTILAPAGVATINGVISGTGSLIATGPGELIITNTTNSYVGTTTISSGTLSLFESGMISTSSAVSISAGAILDISTTTSGTTISTLSGAGNINLGTLTLTVKQTSGGVFSGVIGLGGTSGGLSLSNASTATLTLSGINLYTGTTTINAGTLALSGSGSLLASNAVSVIGTFDISGVTASSTINNMSGSGSILLGSKALTLIQTTTETFSGIISGTLGSLILDATSTEPLTLSGINTYTGATAINGSILNLSEAGSIASSSAVSVTGALSILGVTTSGGASIKNLSGSGFVDLGTKQLTVTQTVPGTFSGVISGISGSLTIGSLSTSTLTLSGLNTYAGATAIEAGTLELSGVGSIMDSSSVSVVGTLNISGTALGTAVNNLSGSGSILLGSKILTVTQTSVGSFSGVISGALGSFVLESTSASGLVLSGINTYTGPTLIDGGTLGLIGLGSIAISSSVTVNGVLDIATTAAGAAIQNFSGSGYVVLGTKTLTVDQSSDGVFSGMILGTLVGGVIKLGPAKLTFTGTNSYEGITTINAGTIQGDTLSIQGPVLNNSALIFNQTSNGTYSFIIAGPGTVEKMGGGTLTLSETSPYTGATTVTAGNLNVNGSITSSSVTITSGATLSGTGTVGPVDNFGTIAPGNSSGTLHVSGPLTFESGSTYLETIDANGLSKLIMTGALTINSDTTFEINPTTCFPYSNKGPFTVMEASSVTGTFSNITTTVPGVIGTLSYSGTSVLLLVSVSSLASFGFVGNELSAAEAIDKVAVSGNPVLDPVICSLYPLTQQEKSDALNQMHPALFKGLIISQENNAVRVQNSLEMRMQNELDTLHCYFSKNEEGEKCCKKKKRIFHIWADGFGDSLHQNATTYANSPQFGYQSSTNGVVLGIDRNFAKHFYLGVLGAYTNTEVTWSGGHSSESISTGYGGLYFSTLGKIFYANTSVTCGWNDYNGERNIIYPGVHTTPKNAHSGIQLLSHLDTGINLGWKGLTFRPFDSFDYITSKERGFKETGGGIYNLTVSSSSSILLRNELGLQLASCFCIGGAKLTLSPKISWVREMRIQGSNYTSKFINTEVPFTVTGYFPTRNLIAPGIVLSGVLFQDLFAFDVYYNGELIHDYSNHTYGGQLRFSF